MEVTSARYPELRVHGAGVKFSDGVAEVSDPAALDLLRGLAHMGVLVPDGSSPPEPDEPPAEDIESEHDEPDGEPEGESGELAKAEEVSAKPAGEPRGNASTETWAEYARGLGVEFPKDATRKDIQEAIDAQ